MLVVAALFGDTEAFRLGGPWFVVVVCFSTALVAGSILTRRSLAMARPLVPLDLLRARLFQLSILTSIGAFMAQTIAFVALPFHIVMAMQHPAVTVGPLMMAWPVAVTVAAALVGRIAGRVSTPALAGAGLRWRPASR